MRTRTKSTPYDMPPSNFTRRTPGGVSIGTYGLQDGKVLELNKETMIDDPDGLYGVSHDCKHTKNRVNLAVIGGVRHEVGPDYGIGYYDEISSHNLLAWSDHYFGVGRMEIDLPNVDWLTESWEAWDKMKPRIETEFSTLNFLHELKDIKKLVDFWSKARSRIKNTANAHLNYSFGWSPLISDVESILTHMVGFNDKWNALVDGANKLHKKHVSRPIKGSWSSTRSQNLGVSCWDFEETVAYEPIMYTATAKYRYTIPLAWRGVPAKFLGAMDAMGLNANPAIVWNAIPYSFVVDWVVGIGSWLDRWTVPMLNLNVELVDFCHSISTSASKSVICFDELPDGVLPHQTVYEEHYSHYERQAGRPSTLGLPRVKSPRWGAVTLATSLATTKSGRPKFPRRARLYIPSRIFVPRNHTGH